MSKASLTGKVALVTGASRGIGAATARQLAEAGASVMLLASKRTQLQITTDKLLEEGFDAAYIVADISSVEDIRMATKACSAKFGGLDILVNNAGVIEPIAKIVDADPDIWSRAIDINIKGVFNAIQMAIPEMISRGGGIIINLSSGTANHALEGWSHYCASKAAVQRLTECAHLEFIDRNIYTIGLSPGTFATDMMRNIRKSNVNPVSQLDWSVHKTPEQVAKAILYLCGPEASQYSGTEFSIKIEENQKLVGI